MHLIDQWRYDVYPFARKSDICVICVILIYILLYFKMTFTLMKPVLNVLKLYKSSSLFIIILHENTHLLHYDKLNTKVIFHKSCIYISLCASIITIAITSTVISIIMKLDPLIRSFRIATKESP